MQKKIPSTYDYRWMHEYSEFKKKKKNNSYFIIFKILIKTLVFILALALFSNIIDLQDFMDYNYPFATNYYYFFLYLYLCTLFVN